MGNPPPTHLITPSAMNGGAKFWTRRCTAADDGPLRIFGYGSLMWSCFDVADGHLYFA